MTGYPLDRAIAHYKEKLDDLEKVSPSLPSKQLVLELLLARDAVEKLQLEQTRILPNVLLDIIELDNRLKERESIITQVADLAIWRESIKNRTEGWWWFFPSPVHSCDRWDWLWNAGTVLLLSFTVSLLGNIASRLFTGGVDLIGAFAVGIPSALSILAAKVVLTEFRRENPKHSSRYQRVPKRLSKPLIKYLRKSPKKLRKGLYYLTDKLRYLKQEANFLLAFVVMGGVLLAYLKLPDLSYYYQHKGMEEHGIQRKDPYSYDFKKNESEKKATAEMNYKRALALDPNDKETHFLLGLFYEDLSDFENARKEYRYAVQGAFPPAYNNLARLYILDKKYDDATSLLIRLKKLDIPESSILEYARLKNLGWIELEQNHLDTALNYLEQAINIASEDKSNFKEYRGSSHCLMAQLISKREARNKKKDNGAYKNKQEELEKEDSENNRISSIERDQWEKCNVSGSTLEGASWLSTAKWKLESVERTERKRSLGIKIQNNK